MASAQGPSVNSSGGVVNAASFTSPVVAGSTVSISGTNLAIGTSPATKPLQFTLLGTSVQIGTFAAPLYSVSPNQIIIQVPWELAGQSSAPLTVSYGLFGGTSSPVTVQLASAAPAIFTAANASNGAGQGLIFVNGSQNNTNNPATPGSNIQIIATGLGAVSNQPKTGTTASAITSSVTSVTPSVTIGGVLAPVVSSQLCPPTLAACNPYQESAYVVTATVPASAPTGAAVPVVLAMGSVSSQNGLTMVVQNAPLALTSISPSSATAGGAAITLTVTGTGFVPGSVVQWNGNARTTTFVSPTQLTAIITAGDIAIAGTAQCTVRNPAASGGGAVSAALTFTINASTTPPPPPPPPSNPPPTINPGGLVNGASFSKLPPAASSITSLFGTNLASSVAVADKLPLPTSLGGVSVIIKSVTTTQSGVTSKAVLPVGGVPAPLFSVAPGQINFQLPVELNDQTQASVAVSINGLVGPAITFDVSKYNPAIFATNQQGTGQGVVLIAATGELVAPTGSIPGRATRPVRRGEYITIYCTGLGPVTNQPENGVAALSNPLSVTTTNANVTLGGIAAPATDGYFAGLAPGFVGLYQVNVQIPQNAPTGDAVPLAISIGGVTSNTVTIAVQ